MNTLNNWKMLSKGKKTMCGKNKLIKSEVKGKKFWHYQHKVCNADSKISNTIDIYGKVL